MAPHSLILAYSSPSRRTTASFIPHIGPWKKNSTAYIVAKIKNPLTREFSTARSAASNDSASITFRPSFAFEKTFPQQVEPKAAIAVPRAVIVPILVPEKPRPLRYCPSKGPNAPAAA